MMRTPWHVTRSEILCFIAVGTVIGLIALAFVSDPLPTVGSVYAGRIGDAVWLKSTPPFMAVFAGIAAVAAMRYVNNDVKYFSRQAHLGMALMLIVLSPFAYAPLIACMPLLAFPFALVVSVAKRERETESLDWLATLFILIVGVYCLVIAYRSVMLVTD